MNYEHGHKEYNTFEGNMDWARCKLDHTKAKDILLECGDGAGSRTFTSSKEASFQLGYITIDKRNFKISKAEIKFSSLVRIEQAERSVVCLRYELFKSFDGRQPLSLGIWMFEKDTTGLAGFEVIENSFDFTFCECQTFVGCCDYFVTVTPIEITGDGVTVEVSNGRMAALAQALYYKPDKEEKRGRDKHRLLESDKIILACGKGSSVSQNVFGSAATVQPSINLAQVTIDTTCLDKPKVLIEFSSIIGMCNQNFSSIVLQFELLRVCGENEPISCGIWTFEEVIVGRSFQTIQQQQPFSFIYCVSLNISECCIYFVKVTPLQTSVPTISVPVSTWEVYNTQINAYAQSSREDEVQYTGYKVHGDKGKQILYNTVHPKTKKLLLECGGGNGSRTFISSDDSPFQLAHVSIDTSSLDKPVVNIEFSSTVSFVQPSDIGSAIVQLRYELFRTCDGEAPVAIGVWMLNRVPLLLNTSTETFNFTYCDCITCPGCCNYFVTATPIRFSEFPEISNATITVGNGRIVAFAKEG